MWCFTDIILNRQNIIHLASSLSNLSSRPKRGKNVGSLLEKTSCPRLFSFSIVQNFFKLTDDENVNYDENKMYRVMYHAHAMHTKEKSLP